MQLLPDSLLNIHTMKISLINPYELGRQPFGLAEPAAWLDRQGCEVSCCDLSIQKLESCLTPDTDVVAIYVAMHTATRIAIEALPRICQLAPRAYLCVYGLYAPMNSELFRSLGVQTVLGGEFETGLVSMVQRIRAGQGAHQTEPEIALDRIDFIAPDRSKLPELSQYASLINPDGTRKTVGFVETTRGCKYLCRHCPVVPVYRGRFNVIPMDIVINDIREQIAQGAEHISFGDPDFFNGPGHALRIVRALHAEFPAVTYDATIKIEHIVRYPEEMQILKDTGCLFILSAVEAVDDDILEHLDFTNEDMKYRQDLVLSKLSAYGFDPSWVDAIVQMLENLLTVSMTRNKAAFSLSAVDNTKRINEMAFYFPLQNLSRTILKQVFDDFSDQGVLMGFPEKMERLTFSPVKGLMKGYLDVLFQHGGRYFIVDWKSNFLGAKLDNYKKSLLNAEMQKAFYVLQYHLYVLATHLHLKMKLPTYVYEKDFGGVFYIFLRCIDAARGPEYGIFEDRPDIRLLDALGKALIPDYDNI